MTNSYISLNIPCDVPQKVYCHICVNRMVFASDAMFAAGQFENFNYVEHLFKQFGPDAWKSEVSGHSRPSLVDRFLRGEIGQSFLEILLRFANKVKLSHPELDLSPASQDNVIQDDCPH